MSTSERAKSVLRARLDASEFVLLPTIFNGLTARIAEEVGFGAIYMTGAGTSISYGLPDVGLVTMEEMLANIRHICEVTSLPLVADADTGYGNVINVRRTVREYERAGVAGLHIEDQTFPKKCGFYEGKSVISTQEHAQKVRAACEARTDPNTVIIARTDALQVHGWDEVEARVRAYRDAGADVVFVDGVRAYDVRSYIDRVVRHGIPALYSGTDLSAGEAAELGFSMQIQSVALYAGYRAEYVALETLCRTGRKPDVTPGHENVPPFTDLVGLPQIYEIEERYGVVREPNAQDAEWEAAFGLLTTYVKREGTSDVPVDHQEDEFSLGEWVQIQKQLVQEIGGREAILTAERRSSLEALPEWDWTPAPSED